MIFACGNNIFTSKKKQQKKTYNLNELHFLGKKRKEPEQLTQSPKKCFLEFLEWSISSVGETFENLKLIISTEWQRKVWNLAI